MNSEGVVGVFEDILDEYRIEAGAKDLDTRRQSESLVKCRRTISVWYCSYKCALSFYDVVVLVILLYTDHCGSKITRTQCWNRRTKSSISEVVGGGIVT